MMPSSPTLDGVALVPGSPTEDTPLDVVALPGSLTEATPLDDLYTACCLTCLRKATPCLLAKLTCMSKLAAATEARAQNKSLQVPAYIAR